MNRNYYVLLTVLCFVLLLTPCTVLANNTVSGNDTISGNDTPKPNKPAKPVINSPPNTSGGSPTNTDSAVYARLAELGTSITEIKNRLESAEDTLTKQEQDRLVMSEQLDILIIGLDQLNNTCMESVSANEVQTLEQQEQDKTYLEKIEVLENSLLTLQDSISILNKSTISGNNALTETKDILNNKLGMSNEQMIVKLTDTLTITNTYLNYVFCFFLFFMVILIVYFIFKLIWNTIIRPVFGRL